MSAAQNQRDGRFAHGCDQLRQRKPCLYVSAHSVQDHQQTVHPLILLDRDKKGDKLLILGRLLSLRKQVMPLNLTDDRQAIHCLPFAFYHDRSSLFNGFNIIGQFFGGGIPAFSLLPGHLLHVCILLCTDIRGVWARGWGDMQNSTKSRAPQRE